MRKYNRITCFHWVFLLLSSLIICCCTKFPLETPKTTNIEIQTQGSTEIIMGNNETVSPTIDKATSYTSLSTPTRGLESISIRQLPQGQFIVYSTISDIDDQGFPIGVTFIISTTGDHEDILFNDYYEDAVLSHDENTLAYVKDREINIMNITNDSVDVIPNTEGCDSPSWSPHDKMIAMDCQAIDGTDVFIVSVENGQRFPLLRKTPTISSTEPIWSPDGKQIAYIAGEFRSGVRSEKNGLYITTSLSILNGETPNEQNTIGPIIWTERFSWSPNGKQLALISEDNEISIYDIEKQSMEILGQYDEIMSVSSNLEWSPDGNWLTFSTISGIYLINMNNSEDLILLKEGSYLYLDFWILVE